MKWLATLFFILGGAMAHADGGKYSIPDNQKWKTECGSCHVAFPPQLLTAGDWEKLMGRLDKHFDTNAVLDSKDNKEILDLLLRHAGSGKKYSAPSLRISETPWFTREHREISSNTWFDPAVKSRSNCTACHVNAERGDWSERGIRVPGGKGREEDGEREHGRDRDDD